MNRAHTLALALPLTVFAAATSSDAQISPGNRLYSPHGGFETYLVDTAGTIVHTWPGSALPGNGVYLDTDGTLLRGGRVNPGPGGFFIGGQGGNFQRRDFDGNLLWDYNVADSNGWAHHDHQIMPNGNILMIVWDVMTEAEAVDAGRDPALITGGTWLPEAIWEVEPVGATGGNVVWEWHMMDHVIQEFDNTKANFGVVADHPEKLDINYPPELSSNGDWNHCNAISYDPINDIVLLNSPFQDEYYLIDHSTTTAEAATSSGGNYGKGGDFLYRWGNPAAYQAPGAQQTFNQHSAKFIPQGLPGAGNVLLFNNQWGSQFGEDSSSIFEVEVPSDFSLTPGTAWGPSAPLWDYTTTPTTDFYSSGLSSVERLPNGNTLVVSGRQNGWMFEIQNDGTKVWEYFNLLPDPTSLVFQVSYYERSLWSSTQSVSAASGGTIDFDLVAGSDRAGDTYLLLGSTGNSPGFFYGSTHIPLNPDFYFTITLNGAGGALYPGTVGSLDGTGNGSAAFNLPAGAATPLIGSTIYHAYAALDPGTLAATHASDAEPLLIEP